jgi:hypothetical protein
MTKRLIDFIEKQNDLPVHILLWKIKSVGRKRKDIKMFRSGVVCDKFNTSAYEVSIYFKSLKS